MIKNISSSFEETLAQAQKAFESKQLDQAKALFEQAHEVQPAQADLIHMLGIIAAQQSDFVQAERYLRLAIEQDPNEPAYHNHLGNTLQAQQRFTEAIAVHRQALECDPNHAESYNNLGNAYDRLHETQAAKDCYRKALDLRQDYLAAWYNLARIFDKEKEFDRAIDCLKSILEFAPHLPQVHFQLGKLYQLQEKYTLAIDHYEKVLDRQPDFYEALYNLGVVLLAEQQLNRADIYFKQAAHISDQSANLQYNLGVIAHQKGEKELAILHYNKAIDLDPAMSEAHQNIANLYAELKEKEKAMAHYECVLALKPNNHSVAYMLQAMKQECTPSSAPSDYIQHLFDRYADHYDRHLVDTLGYQAPQLLLKSLQSVTSLKPQAARILDLGCGTGLCGKLFKPYAGKLIGIDLSKKMLAIAAQLSIYDQLIEDDLFHALVNIQEKADLILAADVFIYVGDLDAVFCEAMRLLQTSGFFCFTVEKSVHYPYKLETTARFAHHEQYVLELIQKYGFSVWACESVALRRQEESTINGLVWILEKNH